MAAHSLDTVFGRDEKESTAARQWLFEPGPRFGEPVAILLNLVLDFNLRQSRLQQAGASDLRPADAEALDQPRGGRGRMGLTYRG